MMLALPEDVAAALALGTVDRARVLYADRRQEERPYREAGHGQL